MRESMLVVTRLTEMERVRRIQVLMLSHAAAAAATATAKPLSIGAFLLSHVQSTLSLSAGVMCSKDGRIRVIHSTEEEAEEEEVAALNGDSNTSARGRLDGHQR